MFRKIMIFASVAAAAWLSSYGHDTQQMHLWAVGVLWITFVMAAQLWPKKKRRCKKHNDTLQHQVERTINFAETQIK